MKVLSFYLLVTAMALMETISAQRSIAERLKAGNCVVSTEAMQVFDYLPAACQHFADENCTKSSDVPLVINAPHFPYPIYTGFIKCTPQKN
ncbi:hypothetical protein [Absidia glauca]|uniref:Uncharacterized protein n=1 Tax=Absidia glauca TaxID=4829 RepID=A0A163MQ78_ABSGL|nr:hypothetical protein [Absidia glauca]